MARSDRHEAPRPADPYRYTAGFAEGGEPEPQTRSATYDDVDGGEQDSEERAFVTRYNRAERAISSIEEEVGRLEKRLDLVLVDANTLPAKEEPENTTAIKELHHSEALRRLETLERQAHQVRRLVAELTERVDL